MSTGRLTVGVALCAYNGARYIAAQLDSILGQTCPPDHVLISDDGSQDDTVAIAEAAARKVAVPVTIVRNAVNKGYLRNFEQAIERCEADVIVLSDQDDCWRGDKLATIGEVFRRDADLGGVFSDAQVVDEALKPMGYGLMDALNVSRTERAAAAAGRSFPVLLRRNIVAGATLAFGARWKERILPLPDGAVHDEWIALVIAAHEALRFIPERLVSYRQHAANQIGARRLSIGERLASLQKPRRAENRRVMALMRNLHARLSAAGTAEAALRRVEAKIAHLERRVSLPESRLMRLAAIVPEIVNRHYSSYSSGWRTAVRDLLSPM